MPNEVTGFPTEFFERQTAFERLERTITELWGHLNAATYRFLVLIAQFDREEAYARHNLKNTAQWLNWQCGIDVRTARQKVRVARALEQLPEISAAFERGQVSYSKVRAMTRVATPSNESVLLNVALHGTAAHVEKLVRKYEWCKRREAAKVADEQHRKRHVSYVYDGSGDFVLEARLPPEIGAIIRKALEMAVDDLRDEEGQPEQDVEGSARKRALENNDVPDLLTSNARHETAAARRADALRYLAEVFIDHRAEATGSYAAADRYQVVVHVDQAVLTQPCRAHDTEPHVCELEHGPALALDTVRRLACNSTLVGMVDGANGVPLDVGRKTRALPPAIARAVKARDGGCRFPGCDRVRYTQGHHIDHWADGGKTSLENVVTLCGFHHGLVHEGGYSVSGTDDSDFVFYRPDGRRIAPNGAVTWDERLLTAHPRKAGQWTFFDATDTAVAKLMAEPTVTVEAVAGVPDLRRRLALRDDECFRGSLLLESAGGFRGNLEPELTGGFRGNLDVHPSDGFRGNVDAVSRGGFRGNLEPEFPGGFSGNAASVEFARLCGGTTTASDYAERYRRNAAAEASRHFRGMPRTPGERHSANSFGPLLRTNGVRLEPSVFALNRALGLAIDAATARCRWGGEVMDYGMAVEALYRRDRRADISSS